MGGGLAASWSVQGPFQVFRQAAPVVNASFFSIRRTDTTFLPWSVCLGVFAFLFVFCLPLVVFRCVDHFFSFVVSCVAKGGHVPCEEGTQVMHRRTTPQVMGRQVRKE